MTTLFESKVRSFEELQKVVEDEGKEAKNGNGAMRMPTGIPGFDDLIGGGFQPGSLYILSGPYGSHHGTFAQQVLYNHMKGRGKVAYYVIENSSRDVIDDMGVYNWNIGNYVDDGSWKFVRLLPPAVEKVAKLAEEHRTEVQIPVGTKSSSSLAPFQDSLQAELKDGRWCTFNISYLLESCSQNEAIELILSMIAPMRKSGGVHFLLLTEKILEQKTMNAIKDLVDGVFEFEDTDRAIEFGTMLQIRKMRRTVLSTRMIKTTLMPSGIIAERASKF